LQSAVYHLRKSAIRYEGLIRKDPLFIEKFEN
jgi:hypothetical protein